MERLGDRVVQPRSDGLKIARVQVLEGHAVKVVLRLLAYRLIVASTVGGAWSPNRALNPSRAEPS